MKKQKLPACHKWSLWLGKEVEGSADVGEQTLFVRNATPQEVMDRPFLGTPALNRVWFCKEFVTGTDATSFTNLLKALVKKKVKLAIELDDATVIAANLHKGALARLIAEKCAVYYKTANAGFPLSAKKDYICAGPAFSDEAFDVGTGKRVKPSAYAKDIKLA